MDNDTERTAANDSNRELKLIALLVGVLLVMQSTTPSEFLIAMVDRYEPSVGRTSLVFAWASVGSLAVLWFAPLVDKRGPIPLMARGLGIAALATITMLLPLGLLGIGASLFFVGVGKAVVVSVVVYAVAARATARWRGFAIGSLAMVPALRLPHPLAAVTHEYGWEVGVVLSATGVLVCAVLLANYLPRLLPARNPAYRVPSLAEVVAAPGFRRRFITVIAVFVASSAVANASAFFPFFFLEAAASTSFPTMLRAIGFAAGAGALACGLASNKLSPWRLMLIAGLALVASWLVPFVGYTNVLLFGMAQGVLLVAPSLIAINVMGTARLATLALAFGFVKALSMTFGPLVGGAMFDKWDEAGFRVGIALLGAIVVAVAIIGARVVSAPAEEPA